MVDLTEALPQEPEDKIEEAERTEKSLRVLELVMLLFVGFGSSLAISLHHWWRHTYDTGTGTRGHPALQSLESILWSLPGLCLLMYVLSRQGRSLRDIAGKLHWSDLPLAVGLVVLRHLPDLYFYFLAGHGVMGRSSGLWSLPALRPEALGALTLTGILVAAANEELIVRAYMMSEILSLTDSAFLAIAASTCFQALYHLYQGPRAMLYVAWTFLLYSLFYWKTRRVAPVVLAHFLMNVWRSL